MLLARTIACITIQDHAASSSSFPVPLLAVRACVFEHTLPLTYQHITQTISRNDNPKIIERKQEAKNPTMSSQNPTTKIAAAMPTLTKATTTTATATHTQTRRDAVVFPDVPRGQSLVSYLRQQQQQPQGGGAQQRE